MEIIFYLVIFSIIGSIPILIHYFKKPNHSDSIKNLYAEGLDMLVVGKRKSAYKIFKSIINQDSSNIKAYLHLGQVVREGGNAKKALEIHKNLMHRKTINSYDKIQLYKNIALDYLKLNDIDKSIEYSINILELDKINEWAINHIIELYKMKGDWDNAILYLKNLFKIKGSIDEKRLALYNIQNGRNFLKDSKFEESRKIFEESLELYPDLKICYYFLGNSFANESNAIYDSAIKIDDNSNGSLDDNNQSQKLKLEAEITLSKAIPMWGHFIENMPDYSWLILPTLKDALQALHRYDDIEKMLINTKNKNENNIDILSHLADFYANKGEVDKALTTINNALDKNKDSLIGQLKKLKINSLKNKESNISVEIDRIINSLLRDKRYIDYKQSYHDKDMKWLFESYNIK